MELRVLNYFLMVAREENVTRASKILHISQPTLSRQMMQLEEELGVKLFKRSNHSIYLTEEGMLLKRRAQEMISLAEKTKKEFRHKDEILSGEISIGSGEYSNMSSFAKLLVGFRNDNPRIHYRMFSGTSDVIKERIENGLLDFGILSEPVDISKYEFIRFVHQENLGVLTRYDSDIADKEYIEPSDLVNRSLLTPSRVKVQQCLEKWFGNHSANVNVAVSFNLLYNAAVMVQNGMGDALCMELDTEYKNLKFIPLNPPIHSGLVMVWKKGMVTSSLASAFIDYFKKYK